MLLILQDVSELFYFHFMLYLFCLLNKNAPLFLMLQGSGADRGDLKYSEANREVCLIRNFLFFVDT